LLSIPGTEALSPAVKYVIAFAIIFLLLALFALVLRRLTGGRLSLPANDRGRTRQPRLGIVDVYDLDRQRQLILLRRDNVEHLLLIGGPNDVVIETNIVRTPGARQPVSPAEQNDRPETLVDRSLEAQFRPQTENASRPESVVARLGPAEPARAGQEPVRNGPTMQPEPFLKPDVVALSPAATGSARAYQQPQPVREAPPPQPLREPPPQPAPQRTAAFKPIPAHAPEAPATRAAPEPPRQPAQPPRPVDPAPGDAAVLSNMAKQLEEALKRPLPPGRPGPAAPNGPVPHAEERPRGIPPAPGRPQPVPTRPTEPAEPQGRSRPAPVPMAGNARPAQKSAAPGGDANDPFSVEEIEAEFARLLGRPLDRNERSH
jgi:flagellar protein FliO/FliZ